MSKQENSPRFEFEDSTIYKKGLELMELVDKIVEAVEKTDFDFVDDPARKSWVSDNLHYLQLNAQLIPAKIAGAYSVGLYDLKMENATLIRKAARELITDARGIQMNGYKETDYLDLLRNEVDAFRILFAEWVKTFDVDDYIIDRWGLFNPPGVAYDDHEPDDDFPFNPDTFFESFEDDDEDWDDTEFEDQNDTDK